MSETLTFDVETTRAPLRGPARILILSASVGAGHLRAAEALELAFREMDPSIAVTNVDVLDMANAAFRRLYGQAYFDLFHMAPHMVGYLYDKLDRPPRRNIPNGDGLRLLAERLNLRPFLSFLR